MINPGPFSWGVGGDLPSGLLADHRGLVAVQLALVVALVVALLDENLVGFDARGLGVRRADLRGGHVTGGLGPDDGREGERREGSGNKKKLTHIGFLFNVVGREGGLIPPCGPVKLILQT